MFRTFWLSLTSFSYLRLVALGSICILFFLRGYQHICCIIVVSKEFILKVLFYQLIYTWYKREGSLLIFHVSDCFRFPNALSFVNALIFVRVDLGKRYSQLQRFLLLFRCCILIFRFRGFRYCFYVALWSLAFVGSVLLLTTYGFRESVRLDICLDINCDRILF